MNNIKNILYISYDGMTDPLGQSQVIPYLQRLSKEGYRFTILSVEKKKRLEKSGVEISKLLKDLGIEWKTLLFSNRPPLLSKIYDQRQLTATAVRLYREKKFDLIHCRSYVAAATGLRLFKRFNVPFLFDMRGFWVNERVDNGQWNMRRPLFRFLYKLYKKKEKKYLLWSSHIVSLTQLGKEELVANYQAPAEKITVIPCCTDLGLFDFHAISSEEKQQLRKTLGIDAGTPVLSYLGSLGGWYMTDEMLDFFAVLKMEIPAVKFLFISHNDREEIFSKAMARGIHKTDILVQPVIRKEVPLYLSLSTWNIFFIKDVYSKKASSPTKQGEVMAMGIPIICNSIGDTGSIVTASGAGFLLDEFSERGYRELVTRMTSTANINPATIRDGAIKFYNLDRGVQKYLDIYQRVIS